MAYIAARDRARWEAERRRRVIDALRAFHAHTGRSPTNQELGCGGGVCHAALPGYRLIVTAFGSLNAGFKAAGVPARKPGERVAMRRPCRPVPRPIIDPKWPVVLLEARAELARHEARMFATRVFTPVDRDSDRDLASPYGKTG